MLGNPEQPRFDFESEAEGEDKKTESSKKTKDEQFWKMMREAAGDDTYCNSCDDQEGGCPQCGFGKSKKRKLA